MGHDLTLLASVATVVQKGRSSPPKNAIPLVMAGVVGALIDRDGSAIAFASRTEHGIIIFTLARSIVVNAVLYEEAVAIEAWKMLRACFPYADLYGSVNAPAIMAATRVYVLLA